MYTLLRLPLNLLELALRQGAGAVKDILRMVAGGGGDERPHAPAERRPDPAAARRDAEAVGAEEARARRPEARPRQAARRRPAPAPERSGDEAPGRGRAERLGEGPAHVSSGAATVGSFGPAGDRSATFDVQAPWDGYDAHSAAEIIRRVRATDEATKAVVLLYERGHKGRTSVIRAAGGQRAPA